VLSPLAAVAWAAFFNFAALFTGGVAVAKAVGGGMIEQSIVDPHVILGGLLGAIFWNLITWLYGIPSSSSHALIGGYAGSAMAKAGTAAITWGPKWVQTLSFIVISPLVGFLAGFALMVGCYWIVRHMSAARVDRAFRPAQLLSSALLSYSHGGNDAQKTMGIILGLLVASKAYFVDQTGILRHLYVADMTTIPRWVEIGAYSMISLGTLFGGWRIVHTMGSRITKLRPIGGFAAETGGAIAIPRLRAARSARNDRPPPTHPRTRAPAHPRTVRCKRPCKRPAGAPKPRVIPRPYSPPRDRRAAVARRPRDHAPAARRRSARVPYRRTPCAAR
jgi:PiT family inorganic phosphate transporter